MITDDPKTEAQAMYDNSMTAMLEAAHQAQANPPHNDDAEAKAAKAEQYDHLMEYYLAQMNRKQRRAFQANLRKIEKQDARDARRTR